MYDEQLIARNELIDEMKREMLGPGSELNCIDKDHELISANPEKRYCLGILFPQGNLYGMEDDDTENADFSGKEDIEEDEDLVASSDSAEKDEKKYRNKADIGE